MLAAIEKLKGVGISDIIKDGDLTLLLLSTYGKLWNCIPDTCTKSMTRYHTEIINKGKERLKIMEQQIKYKLKQGVRIYDAANCMHYTSVNITDSIAAKLLKANPSLAAQFEKLPDPVEPKAKKVKSKK